MAPHSNKNGSRQTGQEGVLIRSASTQQTNLSLETTHDIKIHAVVIRNAVSRA